MYQTIKVNKKQKTFIVKTLLSMAIMILGFTLISLYVPLKGLILGKSFTLIEFLSYIELKKYIVIIISIPIAINAKELRKKTETMSTDRENI